MATTITATNTAAASRSALLFPVGFTGAAVPVGLSVMVPVGFSCVMGTHMYWPSGCFSWTYPSRHPLPPKEMIGNDKASMTRHSMFTPTPRQPARIRASRLTVSIRSLSFESVRSKPVHGEFLKSRGDRRLIQSATVLLPPVRSKV